MDEFDLLFPENPPQPSCRRDAEVQLTIGPRDERPHESVHRHPTVLAVAAAPEGSARDEADPMSSRLEKLGETNGGNERTRDDIADPITHDCDAVRPIGRCRSWSRSVSLRKRRHRANLRPPPAASEPPAWPGARRRAQPARGRASETHRRTRRRPATTVAADGWPR